MAGAMLLCVAMQVTSATSLTCDSGQTLMLAGIRSAAATEAVKTAQRGGLVELALGRTLRCEVLGESRGRIVARCSDGSVDLADEQVRAGYAERAPVLAEPQLARREAGAGGASGAMLAMTQPPTVLP